MVSWIYLRIFLDDFTNRPIGLPTRRLTKAIFFSLHRSIFICFTQITSAYESLNKINN